jgi:hypothetical protein
MRALTFEELELVAGGRQWDSIDGPDMFSPDRYESFFEREQYGFQNFIGEMYAQDQVNSAVQQIQQDHPNDANQANNAIATYLVNNGYGQYNSGSYGIDQNDIWVQAGSYNYNFSSNYNYLDVAYRPGNQPFHYYDPAAPAWQDAMVNQGDVNTDRGDMYLEIPWKFHTIFEWAKAHGNALNILGNIKKVAADGYDLLDFKKDVESRGAFDFKNKRYFDGFSDRTLLDEFGNWHFGVVAEAFGLTLSNAVLGAGVYQQIFQGFNGSVWAYIDSGINEVWSHAASQIPGFNTNESVADNAVRNLGVRFGDNRGDSVAIADGYKSLTDPEDRARGNRTWY